MGLWSGVGGRCLRGFVSLMGTVRNGEKGGGSGVQGRESWEVVMSGIFLWKVG